MFKNLFVKPSIKEDFGASIAVFLVAIPLCLGIAHASGAPLLSGIVSGIVGGIVIGLLSGSHLSVSGPAAGLTAIVIASLEDLQSLSSQGIKPFDAFLAALLVAGVIQIVLGVLKAGIIGSYIPTSIIKGLLAAIGIILILKQFPHVIGYDIEQFGVMEFALTPQDLENSAKVKEENTLTLFFHSLFYFNVGILSIGAGSIAFLILWEKFLAKKYPLFPSSLIVVVIGSLVNFLFGVFSPELSLEKSHLVQIPQLSSMGGLFEATGFPDFQSLSNPIIYRIGFVVAIVALLETLLSIEAIDKLDPMKRHTPVNQEMVAQGIGNSVSAFLGGLPITSVIVRSSVNLNAGAKTKYSSIMHGVFMLLFVLFLPFVLNKIPLASLAAILCHTGFKLTNPKLYMDLYKKGNAQFIPFIVTTIAIVLTDILIGVLIGTVVVIFFIIKDIFDSPAVSVLDTKGFTKVFLGENLTFLHKAGIGEKLKKIPHGNRVVIDGSKCIYIHQDILELLEEFYHQAGERKLQVEFFKVKGIKDKQTPVPQDINYLYRNLFEFNKEWVWEKKKIDQSYFSNMSKGQDPEFLLIGCSDSRVPINVVTKTDPGKIFEHRNIANLVKLDDPNIMSILECAVKDLKVKQIIVCGHYHCNGILTSMKKPQGILGEWLKPVIDLYHTHKEELEKDKKEPKFQEDKLTELNVLMQIENIKKIDFIQQSIQKNGYPLIHAWIYNIHTGFIEELSKNSG